MTRGNELFSERKIKEILESTIAKNIEIDTALILLEFYELRDELRFDGDFDFAVEAEICCRIGLLMQIWAER